MNDYIDNSDEESSDETKQNYQKKNASIEKQIEDNYKKIKKRGNALNFIDKLLIKEQIIRPYYQDVTPSFADEVPFLVDVDSVMITLMTDKNWSNQLGGSTLHLVYIFERYLNIFVQRGGTFRLVFFRNWSNIWHENWSILLYRTVLIQHFSKNTAYKVHEFDNCFDKNFLKFVASEHPGFILTNMNAYKDSKTLTHVNTQFIKNIMNINLLCWLNMDLPCLDSNKIKTDVSIVMGYYLECTYGVRKVVSDFKADFLKFIKDLPKLTISQKLPKHLKLISSYNIRDVTFLFACNLFYEKHKNIALVKIFLLTAAMIDYLELKNRCCPKFTKPIPELEVIVENWHQCMFVVLSEINFGFNFNNVSDIWQGILFGHVYRIASSSIDSSEELGQQVATSYEKLVQDFNNFGNSIHPYPIHLTDANNILQNFETSTITTRDTHPLTSIKNPLFKSFCGDILHSIKWYDSSTRNKKKKIYSEQHHYHSMKVLTDEHDYIKDNKCNSKMDPLRYNRDQNMNARYMTMYGTSIMGKSLQVSGVVREGKNTNKKQYKISKKGQDIIDNNNKSKREQLELQEKEIFTELKSIYKKRLYDWDKLLTHIETKLNNMDSSYRIKTIFLKLKVMLKLIKNNNNIVLQKQIFLNVRELLLSNYDLLPEEKTLLSKCLSVINCDEIARRNNLPIEENVPPFDEFWIRLQIEHLESDLIRETGGQPDPRAKNFIPDPWQKELFDIVDKRESALIIAPTSSGKTYASYYCIESVLKEGSEGVVVYVAPTKALVNQVAAAVYARFKDTKMPNGKSVYGIFTRDFRFNSLTSQILITVPQCLEIILLSPRRYSWVKSLRYVIFDEIHCIEGQIGGISFERCLLLIKCPFLALSATIRNPEGLHKWLQEVEDFRRDRDVEDRCSTQKPYKVNLVIHTERHSDLVKFTYGNGQLQHLHPYADLRKNVIDYHKGIPSHITLSPAEILQLYDTMSKVYGNSPEINQLTPNNFFAVTPQNGFISRNLVQNYGAELSSLLVKWFSNEETRIYFEQTINNLKPKQTDEVYGKGKIYIVENINDFILTLKNQNMLPAIIFAYDRSLIVQMATNVTEYFERKYPNVTNNAVVCKPKSVKPDLDKSELNKFNKKMTNLAGNTKDLLISIERNRNFSDRKLMRKTGQFRCEKPLHLISENAGLNLQGIGIITSDDIKFIEESLRKCGINSRSFIAKSFRNGIGHHHGGLQNKLRISVEILFRLKFLNVVFATGTLALGIHMPCKTTVIVGNSSYLNSLEYHQMAGRAGRRGFDNVGNVVFFGINSRKQHTLLTAKLPFIKGNFPITVSLILRSLLLVSDVTKNGKKSEEATNYAVSTLLTMFENTLCFQSNPDFKIITKHFFCFSLQLLKNLDIIDDCGLPLNWCGLATHLHYHEPGNLAFVYLLSNGIIRQLCLSMDNDDDIQYNLMIVLCYLFTKVPLNSVSEEIFNNSKVILEPLPDVVHEALEKYNEEVYNVYKQYYINVAIHFNDSDNILPLSSIRIEGKKEKDNLDKDNLQNTFLNMCVPKIICSSFAALSGNTDETVYSEESSVNNLKQKMSTDVKIIPVIDFNVPLNAYALDFYRHGIVNSIREDNGIKSGAEFTLLKDFLLVLKTIVVSFEEMRVKDENDVVYKHFKILAYKYDTLFNEAFKKTM